MNARIKNKVNKPRIQNRRARYDYELSDSLVVGIELNGAETKALRLGRGQLQGAYVNVVGGELWLVGAKIFGTVTGPIDEQTQDRNRKLLANRREIDKLIAGRQQGLTIVPTDLITTGRYIKLRISLARGKKRYDKRQVIKKREEERSARQSI
jgi:SsrA-binding protein